MELGEVVGSELTTGTFYWYCTRDGTITEAINIMLRATKVVSLACCLYMQGALSAVAFPATHDTWKCSAV